MEEFTAGWALSASIAAFAKNGRNESLTPSRASKSRFARLRRAAMRLMSASTTVVGWALTARDSTMRRAITVRSRDSFSVRPRSEVSGWAAGDGVRVAVAAAGAAWAGAGAAFASA